MATIGVVESIATVLVGVSAMVTIGVVECTVLGV